MRSIALDMARRGFRVLPCYPGAKVASLEDWPNASLDALGVAEQWPGDAFNVGIHCKGFVVLDVDVKNGRNGLADLQTLPAIPDTFTVKTPSGGFHLYFRTPDGVEVSNSAKNLPAGLDVRGASGYVLAPGSVVDGKPYTIASAAPVAPAPEWLLERLRSAPERKSAPGDMIGALDTPAAVERAKAIIAKAAPAIEGERGNDATYALAARLFPLGLSIETVFDLLQDWNDKCCPPWDDDELTHILENARTYKQEKIGFDNPLHGLETIPRPENAFGAGVTRWTRTAEHFAEIPPRPWLADKRMLRSKITIVNAPGSTGKSLLALQWACSLALGPGLGEFSALKPRERTNVLVVNMEDDLAEMEMRLAAVTMHFKLPEAELLGRVHLWSGQTPGQMPFVVARKDARTGAVSEGEVVDMLIEYCRDNGIGAVIIDPLVDTHECEENSNGEVQRVMRIYRRVATKLNCALVLIHHTKKPPAASGDGFAGSADAGRGASAAINAARVGLTLFQMSQKDGEKYGIASTVRHRYVRLDDSKANLFMASNRADWFRKESVELPNGDQVGVLAPVNLRPQAEGESRRILEILAKLYSVGERHPVKTMAAALAKSEEFSGYTAAGLVAHVTGACESGLAIGGKRFNWRRVGKTGGDIEIEAD